ncbi:MAG: prepilin peptidase [Clostridia bacterium]|nr:prepilin peptidase [Clostridia bacterium]
MVYLVYAASALLGTALVWLALRAFGVSDMKYVEAEAIEADAGEAVEASDEIKEEKIIPYNKIQTIIILVLTALVSFAVAAAAGKNTIAVETPPRMIIGYIKLFSVFVIIAASALIDFKKRIIPNKLVLAGLALRAVLYVCEFVWCRDIIVEIAKSDLTGFLIGFGILFVAGLVTKGAVGFGDAKLFAVIGLTASSLATFGTLLFSLVASSVCGIFLLIKYRDRKRTFPFAPFILIGYAIVIFMGNF